MYKFIYDKVTNNSKQIQSFNRVNSFKLSSIQQRIREKGAQGCLSPSPKSNNDLIINSSLYKTLY